MIRLIYGVDRDKHTREIDAMHRNRAAVFHGRLGWAVEVVDGWEIDGFDRQNPLYLISVDELTGAYCGSMRVLPTTGPNMLRDVFSSLLDDDETIASATIWEASRFVVDPRVEAERTPNRLNRTTGELLAGVFELSLMAGMTQIVAVYDGRMARVFERADCPPDIIGTPRRIGKVVAYAGLFDVTEEVLASVRAAAGVEGSILETEVDAKARFVA